MSIYIQGMAMPMNHRHMILMSNGDITDLDGKTIAKAIELPPHGRLGDLDAMAAKDDADYEDAMASIADVSTRSKVCKVHYAVQEMIAEAETILPADPPDPEEKEVEG